MVAEGPGGVAECNQAAFLRILGSIKRLEAMAATHSCLQDTRTFPISSLSDVVFWSY